ncbi:MAG: heavy-metal-associated domain-containing protein [Actinobacteria bacterium]|nr:heavy-metal-associated domain-containing protein [Actinomycetota bacterium]
MSYYIHNVSGRLRIKTPSLKGSQRAAAEVKELLRSVPGVSSTTINMVTGSIVVNYDPGVTTPKEIVHILQRAGHFDLSKAVTNDQYICTMASKAGTFIGKQVAGAFVDRAVGNSASVLLAMLK